MEARNVVLFDIDSVHENLLPLSYTRPVCDFLIGILTIRQKWEALMPGRYSCKTAGYLAEKFSMHGSDDTLFMASHIIPEKSFAEAVAGLENGRGLIATDRQGKKFTAAYRGTVADFNEISECVKCGEIEKLKWAETEVETVEFVYDIFLKNAAQIECDFESVTSGREGQAVPRSNTVIGDPELVFIESGAVVEGAVLNVSHGPIYIGRNAEVMEGSCLRGPIAIGCHSTVNMGSKIYPGTSLGPWCKVGGELNNAVIFGYSNKAHDGFLGNAVIGEWCNLGAGCVASNLKNDYTEIKLWNYPSHRFLRTGLQFCGLIMADHSKAGINTMFNTATVLGVGVNIHGSGFPRNFVASFSEGGASGFTDVPMQKFFDVAVRVMSRRGRMLTDADRRLFEAVREQADNYK